MDILSRFLMETPILTTAPTLLEVCEPHSPPLGVEKLEEKQIKVVKMVGFAHDV